MVFFSCLVHYIMLVFFTSSIFLVASVVVVRLKRCNFVIFSVFYSLFLNLSLLSLFEAIFFYISIFPR